ncbi:MAG: hypothetical protein NT031_01050 [Planctomycetota bacterium]|nr:hypothetical protein [Planctomycetota bacterium]
MKSEVTGSEKWRLFLAGQDVGPMVSPLCDDWTIDVPYRWPFPEPDPFPPGHGDAILSEQMAMAGVCGWDATFLCGGGFIPAREEARPKTKVTPMPGGGNRVENCYTTPYGDLTCITEAKTLAWVIRAEAKYNDDEIIADGWRRKKALRERGLMGTWFGPPVGNSLPSDEKVFYLASDYPEAFAEVSAAQFDLACLQVDLLAKAGFDYLFYCVNGTEWGSPSFFRDHMQEPTRKLFKRWHDQGGVVLWHSGTGLLQRPHARHSRDALRAAGGHGAQPGLGEGATRPPHRHQGQHAAEHPAARHAGGRSGGRQPHPQPDGRVSPRRRAVRRPAEEHADC